MVNTTHCLRVKIVGRPKKCHRNQQTWVGDRARNEFVRLWNWLEHNLPGYRHKDLMIHRPARLKLFNNALEKQDGATGQSIAAVWAESHQDFNLF